VYMHWKHNVIAGQNLLQ